jgi:hypothetical protein
MLTPEAVLIGKFNGLLAQAESPPNLSRRPLPLESNYSETADSRPKKVVCGSLLAGLQGTSHSELLFPSTSRAEG